MRYLTFILLVISISCSKPKTPPNFLFFFSDDHTTQAISAYGDGRIHTPHIDRLAADGVLFENCFCTNSICAPSRAVVLTGRYSHLNGVIDNTTHFDGSQETIVKILQDEGYRTAIVGKWHLKSIPTGFDYWMVLPGQGEYFDPEFIEMGKRIQRSGYVTRIITEAAQTWLSNYNYDQPFCLLVQHKAPHANWEWPEDLRDEFTNDFPLPDGFDDQYDTRGPALAHSHLKVDSFQWNYHYKYRFGGYPYTHPEEMYQRYMHDYMRCIREVDNSVGQIMEILKKTGQDQNTIVIYSADQGFFLGEHGLYDKRFMYEEALRMPLIVSGSGLGVQGSGFKVPDIVTNLDFAPTLLSLAGIPISSYMQGTDLSPLLRGDTGGYGGSMYYRFYEQAYGIGEHEGIRTQTHKLIHFFFPVEAWELYDLNQDPKEMNNLYGSESMDQLTEALKKSMDSLKWEYDFY